MGPSRGERLNPGFVHVGPEQLVQGVVKEGVRVSVDPLKAWLYSRSFKAGDSAEIPVLILDLRGIPRDVENPILNGLSDLVKIALGRHVKPAYSRVEPILIRFSSMLRIHRKPYLGVVKALQKSGVTLLIDTARLELYARKIMGRQI